MQESCITERMLAAVSLAYVFEIGDLRVSERFAEVPSVAVNIA